MVGTVATLQSRLRAGYGAGSVRGRVGVFPMARVQPRLRQDRSGLPNTRRDAGYTPMKRSADSFFRTAVETATKPRRVSGSVGLRDQNGNVSQARAPRYSITARGPKAPAIMPHRYPQPIGRTLFSAPPRKARAAGWRADTGDKQHLTLTYRAAQRSPQVGSTTN